MNNLINDASCWFFNSSLYSSFGSVFLVCNNRGGDQIFGTGFLGKMSNRVEKINGIVGIFSCYHVFDPNFENASKINDDENLAVSILQSIEIGFFDSENNTMLKSKVPLLCLIDLHHELYFDAEADFVFFKIQDSSLFFPSPEFVHKFLDVSADPDPNELTLIIQFPDDLKGEIGFDVGTNGRLDSGIFYYEASTGHGSSGAPVLQQIRNKMKVVSIHRRSNKNLKEASVFFHPSISSNSQYNTASEVFAAAAVAVDATDFNGINYQETDEAVVDMNISPNGQQSTCMSHVMNSGLPISQIAERLSANKGILISNDKIAEIEKIIKEKYGLLFIDIPCSNIHSANNIVLSEDVRNDASDPFQFEEQYNAGVSFLHNLQLSEMVSEANEALIWRNIGHNQCFPKHIIPLKDYISLLRCFCQIFKDSTNYETAFIASLNQNNSDKFGLVIREEIYNEHYNSNNCQIKFRNKSGELIDRFYNMRDICQSLSNVQGFKSLCNGSVFIEIYKQKLPVDLQNIVGIPIGNFKPIIGLDALFITNYKENELVFRTLILKHCGNDSQIMDKLKFTTQPKINWDTHHFGGCIFQVFSVKDGNHLRAIGTVHQNEHMFSLRPFLFADIGLYLRI